MASALIIEIVPAGQDLVIGCRSYPLLTAIIRHSTRSPCGVGCTADALISPTPLSPNLPTPTPHPSTVIPSPDLPPADAPEFVRGWEGWDFGGYHDGRGGRDGRVAGVFLWGGLEIYIACKQ